MKKYKDLYEQEKQRHEETLQRYQDDHMDEMEIINLYKRCNKEVPQPKKASSKSDKPKKVINSLEFLDDPSEEKQNSKPADGKKTATKTGKKVKKALQSNKSPQPREFIDSCLEEEEEEPPKDDKGRPLLGVKKKSQSFFDLRKDSKNLTNEKELKRVVFMRGPYNGYELSNVALCDTDTSRSC